MPCSPTVVIEWLTRLRVLHEAHARRDEQTVRASNAAYIDALRDMDPRWLSAAVDWWCRNGEHMPKPAHLRKTADELAANAAAADKARKLAIANGTDPGSVARQEVIQLCHDLDNHARRHFGNGDTISGSKSLEYKNWLSEVARYWLGMRPPKGVEDLHEQRIAWKVARELQDHGRSLLGMPPLPALPPAPNRQRADAVQKRIDELANTLRTIPPEAALKVDERLSPAPPPPPPDLEATAEADDPGWQDDAEPTDDRQPLPPDDEDDPRWEREAAE